MNAPEQVHARLDAVLSDGIELACALRDTLVEERTALERRDAEALSHAIESKAARLRELAELEQVRATVLKTAGFADLPSAAASCGGGDALVDQWDKYSAIAAECDTLNLGNGAAIRLRQQQVAEGLALLRGAEPVVDTYGPAGSGSASGRELTEA